MVFLDFQQRVGTGFAIPFGIWALALSLLIIQLLSQARLRTVSRTLAGGTIFSLGLIPIVFPEVIMPDYYLRLQKHSNVKTINEKFDRIVASLSDPEAVLEASRKLHLTIVELPEPERRIGADSNLISPLLSKLEPTAIYADDTMLRINLLRNYEKTIWLYAYKSNGEEPLGSFQFSRKKLADGLWLVHY